MIRRLRRVLSRLLGAILGPLVDKAVDQAMHEHLSRAVHDAMAHTIDTQWRRYLALAALATRTRPPATLAAAECRVFSQNGEDGVLHALIQHITVPRFFVEFGAGSGAEGNCVLLADVFDWSGLFIESHPPHFEALQSKYRGTRDVDVDRNEVTPSNVVELFATHTVPSEFGVLSIDVDGLDYWIWDALVGYRPAIVVIEYNGSFPPGAHHLPSKESARWNGEGAFGASLRSLVDLGKAKGYELVHTDLTGVNAFFVRGDLVGDLPRGDEVFWRRANYFFQWQGFDGPAPDYFQRD